MGKKKKRELKPWCWYCDREFEDEKILINHQKAKHFKCSTCNKRLNSANGMKVHMENVHKEQIDRVPGSIEGRDSFDHEIFGMQGVPDEDIRRHEEAILGPDKRTRLEPSQPQPPFPLPFPPMGGFPVPPPPIPGMPPPMPGMFMPGMMPPLMPGMPFGMPMMPPPMPGMPPFMPPIPPQAIQPLPTQHQQSQQVEVPPTASANPPAVISPVSIAVPLPPPPLQQQIISPQDAFLPAYAAKSAVESAEQAPASGKQLHPTPSAVPASSTQPAKEQRLIWEDESQSIEERRASLERYRFHVVAK